MTVVGRDANLIQSSPTARPPLALGSFNININPNSTLLGNTAALAAFERAASNWERFIADPITVNINGGLGSLGTGIIGSASSVSLVNNYAPRFGLPW
ncbi:MAG TPA: hypothetical protein VGB55_12920 [Tepidisphaeraceae bacterium]